MRKLELNRVREIQLEILEKVAAFCDTNKIKYWIDCGTLLGAIRHKGFIPWDDDVDVGMLREDYDQFSKIFNQESSRYQFVCIENTPDFFVPHGKVIDTTTVLYEPDEQGEKTAVNVDIFVYDNAPNEDALVAEMFAKRDRLRKRYTRQHFVAAHEKNLIKKLAKLVLRTYFRAFYPLNCMELMVENAMRYACEETTRVGNFTSFAPMICDKNVFASFIEVEFEGRKFKAPVGYDQWLRSFYGEYMQLPPIEKQVSHHRYIAFEKV